MLLPRGNPYQMRGVYKGLTLQVGFSLLSASAERSPMGLVWAAESRLRQWPSVKTRRDAWEAVALGRDADAKSASSGRRWPTDRIRVAVTVHFCFLSFFSFGTKSGLPPELAGQNRDVAGQKLGVFDDSRSPSSSSHHFVRRDSRANV